MSPGVVDERVDAVGAREAGELRGEIEDVEGRAARFGGTLPCKQYGERGRIELRQRRAIDGGRTRADARKTVRERGLRARDGQRGPCFEAAHDACLPEASCWLRCVRNW